MTMGTSFQECNFWKTEFKAVIAVLTIMMLITFDQKLLIMTKGENKTQKRTITKTPKVTKNTDHFNFYLSFL